MTDRAERQVGEQLSEQELILVSRCARGVASAEEGKELARFVDSLARQLAEAERRLERERGDFKLLEAQDSRIAEHRNRLLEEAKRYREALERIAAMHAIDAGTNAAARIARAALSPPDPPASPAEGSEAATEVEA